MYHLIADVWQGFADLGSILMFAATEAETPEAQAALENAAQYCADVKAQLDATMAGRGLDPATKIVEE